MQAKNHPNLFERLSNIITGIFCKNNFSKNFFMQVFAGELCFNLRIEYDFRLNYMLPKQAIATIN
jgi:hypothetical protein